MSFNGVLPADLAEHEAHRLRGLEAATLELRRARELLENLTRASELAQTLRAAPALISRITSEVQTQTTAHHRVLERHEACATQLDQARRELEHTTEVVQELMEVAEIRPKLQRIRELIDVLDRAELIRWDR